VQITRQVVASEKGFKAFVIGWESLVGAKEEFVADHFDLQYFLHVLKHTYRHPIINMADVGLSQMFCSSLFLWQHFCAKLVNLTLIHHGLLLEERLVLRLSKHFEVFLIESNFLGFWLKVVEMKLTYDSLGQFWWRSLQIIGARLMDVFQKL